jgi:tetratricopeptide (TPR) repeat protein
MRRLFAPLRPLLQRRRLLIVLGIAMLLLAGLSPFLWASYHWYAGRAALKRFHHADALEHLDACLRFWPWSRSSGVHLLAARAARRQGDFEEAQEHIRECQDRLGDTSPETMLEWSLLHAAAGHLDTVEGYLQDRARKNPKEVPLILEALAEGYSRMARMAEAIHCVNEWLAREPDNVQALYLRGNLARQTGSSQKSVADFRRVVELDPEHPYARWWLAIGLTDIGRYEEAAGHLEVLHRWRPDDLDILTRLAICRHHLGRGPEARALLDTVLARNPDHGLALLTRGQMLQLSGQLAESEETLHHAVRVMPNDYKAHFWLMECLRKEGKTEAFEAERARTQRLKDRWERLTEINNTLMSQHRDDPALQCELGQLFLELGMPDIGKSWLLNALRLDENCTAAYLGLADYYQQRGEEDTAAEYRRRAEESAKLSRASSTVKSRP